MTTRIKRLAAMAAAPLLVAMTFGGVVPNNGYLDHADDLRWVFFQDVTVKADTDKGEYVATFSPALSKMDGRDFSITGYMLSVEPTTHSPHFVLTRRSAGCPFCPPNEPTEAIEVKATMPVDYRVVPVTVSGRLKLVARSADGLFYRLENAKVV